MANIKKPLSNVGYQITHAVHKLEVTIRPRPYFGLVFIFLVSFFCIASSNCHAEPDVIQEFYGKVEPMLTEKRYGELDAMADEFRKSDARFLGGDQKLRHFYYGLGSIEGQTCGCGGYESSISFEQKEPLVRQWLAKKPQSIAAHIVMARMLTNYAWKARGHGYANTVTDEQEKIYEDRLAQAAAVIKELNPKDDPQIYGVYTTIARASSNPRPKLDAIYAEVTKQYSEWFISYANRADILQEKWFGQPGELAIYSQSLLSTPGGETGKIAYSYVADRLVGQYRWQELYTVTGLTWPLVKEAYAIREKKYGMNNNNWNILLSLAVAGRDMLTAKMAIQHIGDDWDSEVWKEKKYFDQTVAWVKSH